MLPFFRSTLLMVVSNFSFRCIQRSSGFSGSPAHLFQSSHCVVQISMEASRNCVVWSLGCTVDALSIQFMVFKQLLRRSSRMWLSIVLTKNPPSEKFWSFPLDMIKESFQYHLVIRDLFIYHIFRGPTS